MSKKKTKFQLGDHVTYSNKRGKYSYTGEVIAKQGRHCVVEIISSTGNVLFKSRKDINDWTECIPEKFDMTSNIWGSRKSISAECVWDTSQHLHHVMKPYDVGQNGDTDDDI